MNDHGSRLREAFETHESLAPDPAEVYAEVQRLAKSYQRRRRGMQAAGGAVLSAGLIAGVINLPALLPGAPQDSAAVVAPAVVTPSAATQERELDAYFAAGYDYADAVELAKLWKRTGEEISQVKAEAGRKLLAGETLPFAATPNAPHSDSTEDRQADAFFAAGYDYDDAVRLAEIWKRTGDDIGLIKSEAGRRLLAGETLPIPPSPADTPDSTERARVEAFFKAGYDYDDAVKLAGLWDKSDAYQAKVEGGKRILAGETLPFKP